MLQSGLSYRITAGSNLNIWDTRWIPKIPNFKIPPAYQEVVPFDSVKDLIDQDLEIWKSGLVQYFFPPQIAREILKIRIPILEESDYLIWTPSATGRFSVNLFIEFESQRNISSGSGPSSLVIVVFGRSYGNQVCMVQT